MNPTIRKQALRATMKIALVYTVAGCQSGGTTQHADVGAPPQPIGPATRTDQPAVPTPNPLPAPTPAPPAEKVADDAAQCGAEVPPNGTERTKAPDETVACCHTFVESKLVTNEKGLKSLPAEARTTKAIKGCCIAVVQVGVWSRQDPVEQACCDVEHDSILMGCTPWGPPRPPAVAHLPAWPSFAA